MKLRLALAAATAMGLPMGAAFAGSSNTLHIVQSGTGNAADIHQSGAETYNQVSSGNDIGTSGVPVKQDGTGNRLTYSNAGYGTGSDNDIVKLLQDGDGNSFDVRDSNGATGTRINDVLQQGNNNQMTILRAGEQESVVDQVRMEGNGNTVYVKQLPLYYPSTGYGPYGGRNTISLIKVVGDSNGISGPNGPAYSPGIYIEQHGNATTAGFDNRIAEVSIEGSNNPVGYGTAISIIQAGSDNGQTASIARMKGSNGNGIVVRENGDSNNFSVQQGISSSSTGNYATVDQLGSFNSASVTQFGDSNQVIVDQNGDGNTATANFTGSGNGVGTLTGAAGALDTARSELTQGTIFQDSLSAASGNTVTYNVTGSNNRFAFAQIGGANTITGNVGNLSASTGNQVAVIQAGSSNASSFSQNGGSNNLAVSQ